MCSRINMNEVLMDCRMRVVVVLLLLLGSGHVVMAQTHSAPVYDHPRYLTDRPPYRRPHTVPVFGTSTGGTVIIDTPSPNATNIFAFLLPECPISQQCTAALNELYGAYSGAGMAFYGVMPGKMYTASEAEAFRIKYRLRFQVLLDTGYVLTRKLEATVAPQVVVTDAGLKVLYSGAVDNSYRALGKRNAKTTLHYVQDALASIATKQPVRVASSVPVGCKIEFLKASNEQ